MSNLHLPQDPTLPDYQQYIREMILERGFKDQSISELLMLLMEECGELARACRKHTAVQSDITRETHKDSIDHELADCLMYILAISNHFDIDLERAFREKEEINKKRIWSK